MKRSALLILTAIYLLSCVGIGINRFYCCDKLTDVTITYATPDNSSKDAGKNDNCCKHQKQSFKIKDSHFSVVSLTLNHRLPVIKQHVLRLVNVSEVPLLLAKNLYRANAQPLGLYVPVYTLNCAYRI